MIADADLEARYVGHAIAHPGVLIEHPLPPGAIVAPALRAVLDAVRRLVERGDPVDPDSLDVALSELGHQRLRGPYVLELVGSLDNPQAVAERLRDLCLLRQAQRRASAVLEALRAPDASVARVRAEAEALVQVLDSSQRGEVAIETSRDLLVAVVEDIVRRSQLDGAVEASTGLDDLDQYTGGIRRGDVWVVGGDPGSGKSHRMLSAAIATSRAGRTVGLISLEDGSLRIGQRYASRMAAPPIPVPALQRGRLTRGQHASLATLAEAEQLPILFACLPGASAEEVSTACRALTDAGAELIIVDYLQAFGRMRSTEIRHHIRDAMEMLRRVASQGVGILAGSQLRKRDRGMAPTNGDLYESAYIEQKADAIVLLWRERQEHEADRFRWSLSKHKDVPPLTDERVSEYLGANG